MSNDLLLDTKSRYLFLLLLYMDDLFLTGDEKLITESKRKLVAEFEMKDLGMMHYLLGLEV
jgi:hypothetical protein